MIHVIGSVYEALIQYTLLSFIVALLSMLILLILLYARDRVMGFLKIEFLRELFDKVCEMSDRLDEIHIAKNPYGNAMWLTRLIGIGIFANAGMIILWIMNSAIRS
jgi:hypothetical protein